MSDENTTILVLNSVKKIKGFKVNRKRIRFAIITASTFVVLLLLSLGGNYYLFRQYNNVNEQLATLQAENAQLENRSSLVRSEPDSENQVQGTNEPGENSPVTANSNGDDNEEAAVEDITAGDKESSNVNIQNLIHEISLNGLELLVEFNLTKNPDNEIISGYVVVIATTTDNLNPYVSWPEVDLNDDGTILDIYSGGSFSMRQLTQKRGRIMLDDPAASFRFFRIYVYDTIGSLIMRKTIPITG
ncbi:MAG: hypothetical protein GY863_17505 [bacterium]|nr:hypothetical protein [bacterium]